MKNIILKISVALALLCGLSACSYLDVDPELGVTEEDVFSNYTSALGFFDLIYDQNSGKNKTNIGLGYPFYIDLLNNTYCAWVSTTDAADCGKLHYAQRNFKQCNLSQDILNLFTFSTAQSDKPIALAMFNCIRVANKTIANFPMLLNGTEKERNDLLGQAYFCRGFCHFVLCRYFGGMPYIDYVIGADDSWDIPRETAHDTYVKAAEDLNKAAEYLAEAGYYRRNSPDNPGANTELLLYPTVVMAKAVRARALLYAASPLNNTEGQVDWERAADAAGDALKSALDWGYVLTPIDNISDNYYGQIATNESIFVYNLNSKDNVQNFSGMLSKCQSDYSLIKGASGTHPTQNFVDRFETSDGRLLRTESQRAKAIAAGKYKDQDPYSNRDPRMDLVIIHDGSPAHGQAVITGGNFNIYYDPSNDTYPPTMLNSKAQYYCQPWGSADNDVTGVSCTGYYCKRYWRGGAGSVAYVHTDPMFRLGELYLNYAEAVNEAYGPSATAPGYEWTALQAVDVIRDRCGMPSFEISMSNSGESVNTENFRYRIRNERCVELAFESNHYYFDIRRWKEAPELMNTPLYGMWVEKVDPSADYPKGRKYTRKAIPSNRQCVWKDCMYVLPFPDTQANTMKNFVNNPKWQ